MTEDKQYYEMTKIREDQSIIIAELKKVSFELNNFGSRTNNMLASLSRSIGDIERKLNKIGEKDGE